MQGGFVLPPTPPPDIDLEAWERSIELIGRWRPDTLLLTHFGPSSPAPGHLSALRDHIGLASRLVQQSLAREGTDDDREKWYADQLRLELIRRMNVADAHAYESGGALRLELARACALLAKEDGYAVATICISGSATACAARARGSIINLSARPCGRPDVEPGDTR